MSRPGLLRRGPADCRGSVLVCVIVCLSVATIVATSMTQSALQARRQVGVERQMRQVELLLEAGVRRAVQAVKESPDGPDEIWNLPADAVPGFTGARVEIRTTGTAGKERSRVRVTAELADSSQRTVRRSYEFAVLLDASPTLTEE